MFFGVPGQWRKMADGAVRNMGRYKMQEKRERIKQRIKEAELVLTGIGEQFAFDRAGEEAARAYRNLSLFLEGKNYFVITTCTDGLIRGAGLKEDRIVCPLSEEADDKEAYGQETLAWERYMKWLQGTLNRKLLVLELGVGLACPDVIRFPFEKVVFYNQKAELIRVHPKLFQLPAELKGRGMSVCEDTVALLAGAEISEKVFE